MPDEISVRPAAENTAATTPGQENQIINTGRSRLISFCAVGLGISYFLPWADYVLGKLSGFDLQKLGDEQRLLLLIPLFCAITVFAGITKRSQQIAGQLTGALPYIAGIYWWCKLGSDLLHILTYGAYLSLIFGAAIFILARKAK